jgi:hypothetical protein
MPEWVRKFIALKEIQETSYALPTNFACATTVRKEDGRNFLLKFVDGPLDATKLVKNAKLPFLVVKSKTNMQDILSLNQGLFRYSFRISLNVSRIFNV